MMGAGVIRVGLSWSRTLEQVCEDSEPCPRRRPGTPAAPSPSTGQDLIGHGPWPSPRPRSPAAAH